MARVVAAFLGAAVLGAFGMRQYLEHGGASSSLEPIPSIGDSVNGAGQSPDVSLAGEASSYLGTMLVHYAAASQRNDGDEIEQRIESLLRQPGVDSATSELEALLLRFVALDGERAIRFARQLGVPQSTLIPMFQAWAEQDLDSALAAIQRIEDRALRWDVGLGLVNVVAIDESSLERLRALMDPSDRGGFAAEALVRVAVSEPGLAMTMALNLPDYWVRYGAARRIAFEWARHDPEAALRAAEQQTSIESLLRNEIRLSVFEEWVSVDPDAALRGLMSPTGQSLFNLQASSRLRDILERLALRRPEELLAAADALPRNHRETVRAEVLSSLADADPLALARRADLQIDSADRAKLLESVAISLARSDAQAAFDWADALQDRPPRLMRSLLTEIARSDFRFAVDVALGDPILLPYIESWVSPSHLSSMSSAGIQAVANRLSASGASGEQALAALVVQWTGRDGGASQRWLMTRPAEQRRDLIFEVAGKYLQSDMDAALDWISRFRNEPDYDALVVAAASQSLQQFSGGNPRDVAMLLASVQRPDPQLSASVVSRWAQSEPRAAAEWAAGFATGEARSSSIAAAVASWTAIERGAAERWTLNLPRGEIRDRALSEIVARSVVTDDVAGSNLLNAFGNDAARQQALAARLPVLRRLAREDPDRARELVDIHIEDTGLRRQLIEEIDDMAEVPAGGA